MRLIEAAIAASAADESALAAPYNNLAFMHEKLGNEADAKKFAEMATQTNVPQRR